MLYFYHPCVKPSHQGTVAKSCSRQQVKIGEMWTKWLTNFVICDLSCANGSTSFVWWLILQIISKEFKKSHCVVVSLQPSEPRLLWPLTCIRPSGWLPGSTKKCQMPWCKIIIWLQVLMLFIKFRLKCLANIFIQFEITNLYLGIAVVITWVCHWNKFSFTVQLCTFIASILTSIMASWACWVTGCNGAHRSWIKSCGLLF